MPSPRPHGWGSSKRPPNPPGWKQLREVVIARANGMCQHEDGCNYEGKDVDHIVNLASGGTHDLNNLRLLCTWHHKQKTAEESKAARKPQPSQWRAKETHPGLL